MEWKISPEPVDYEKAVAFMEARVEAIIAGAEDELVWLLEHPPLYTAGTSARAEDLKDALGFPVYKTGRGGQFTYHGPGQRIAYVMLDLRKRGQDIHAFVRRLEDWIILTLAQIGVKGELREGRVGVWVKHPVTGISPEMLPHKIREASLRSKDGGAPPMTESKIAALGIRVRHWVTYHGIAVNIHPDLGNYRGIVPCGLHDFGVTSLQALGIETPMQEFDNYLIQSFSKCF